MLLIGSQLKRYHADNGRFENPDLRKAVEASNQRITLCAIGSHYQNGMVERHIKELTLVSRTLLLLHAKRYWPEIIITMIWPFVVKADTRRQNKLILNKNGKTAEEIFYGIASEFDPKNLHTWGCPVYV